MSPKTGRPLSSNSKTERMETRMTVKDFEKLDFCCEKTGKTRSEIVRNGIDIIYSNIHHNHEKK